MPTPKTTLSTEAVAPPNGGISVSFTIEQTSYNVQELMGIPLSAEPSAFVRVRADQITSPISDWNLISLAPGIYVLGERCGTYRVGVNTAYFDWLFKNNLEFEWDFEPTGPVRAYDEWLARREVDACFIEDGMMAILNGRHPTLDQGLRYKAQKRHRLRFEWAILGRDVECDLRVRTRFTQLILLVALSLIDDYNSLHALELLEKSEDELFQGFQDLLKKHCAHLPEKSVARFEAEAERTTNYDNEFHVLSLYRLLLEFAKGKEDFYQRKIDPQRTANFNANTIGSLVHIRGTKPFGSFDSQKVLNALSKSPVFPEPIIRSLNIVKLRNRMIACLPIGFPDGYLNLPAELLGNLGHGQVQKIHIQIAHFYREHSSLQSPKNNILVLLTLNSFESTVEQVLAEWMASDDGRGVYQRIVEDMQDPQTTEQLALALAALIRYQRLLSFIPNITNQLTRDSYQADFDAILNCERLGSEQIFERIALSILRVFWAVSDKEKMRQFLFAVLDKDPPIPEFFDEFLDQYSIYRMRDRLAHKEAFEMAGLGARVFGRT